MSTNESLAGRLANLSRARRALLERRLKGRAAAPVNQSRDWSPMVEMQPGGSGKKFFGVHPLSGSVASYIDLARMIGEDQTFYALQARGLDTDDEPFTRLEEMAACYVAAVRAVQPEGPYLLTGFSLGGHIAYEMAQQLCAGGSRVGLLALIDTSCDGLKPPWEGDFDGALYWHWRLRKEVSLSVSHMRGLDPERLLDYVVEQLKTAERQPAHMSLPHADLCRMARVEQSNQQALFGYEHKPYPGAITLLRTGHGTYPSAPPDLGWGPLAGGGVEAHMIPGAHRTILQSPYIEVVGRVLRDCIARAA